MNARVLWGGSARTAIQTVLLSLALGATACGRLLQTPSLKRAAEKAEIIVKARVLEPEVPQGPTTEPAGFGRCFRCKAIYTIKGSLSEDVFRFFPVSGDRTLRTWHFIPGQTYLLFLRSQGNVYVQVDEPRAELLADPNLPANPPAGESATDRLKTELTAWLGSKDKAVLLDALEFLPEVTPWKEAPPGLSALPDKTGDDDVDAAATRALLRLGHPSAVRAARAFLNRKGPVGEGTTWQHQRLVGELAYVGDPQVADDLIALMRHPDPRVRQNVAQALRNMRWRSLVPHLIDGLRDEDDRACYRCLMGLAEVLDRMNPDWATSLERFQKRREELVGRWLTWWETEGKNLDWTSPPPPPTTQPQVKGRGTERSPSQFNRR